jgi:hypothetical protein
MESKKNSKNKILGYAILVIIIASGLGIYEVLDLAITGDTYRKSVRITACIVGLITGIGILFFNVLLSKKEGGGTSSK